MPAPHLAATAKASFADRTRVKRKKSEAVHRAGGLSCWAARAHNIWRTITDERLGAAASLPLHLGVADHLAPFRLVGLDALRELLWGAGNRFEILPVEKILPDLGIGEGAAHLLVELADNRGRHAG